MKSADLILYPEREQPTRLLRLDSTQCVEYLIPYLKACRMNGRISAVVAELDFPDGEVLWFASEEGQIDVHHECPRFGTLRKWAGIIPAPMKRQFTLRVSDDQIRGLVLSAYETKATELKIAAS